MSEPSGEEATENASSMELGTITVRSLLRPDGKRSFTVAHTPGFNAVDMIGLLETAKLALYEQHLLDH